MSQLTKSQRRVREEEFQAVLFSHRQEPVGRALQELLADWMQNAQENLAKEIDLQEIRRLQGEHRGFMRLLKSLIEHTA